MQTRWVPSTTSRVPLAIYHLGCGGRGRRWRTLLRPGGLMAVTEATWLTDERPEEVVAFWREAYPAMGSWCVTFDPH